MPIVTKFSPSQLVIASKASLPKKSLFQPESQSEANTSLKTKLSNVGFTDIMELGKSTVQSIENLKDLKQQDEENIKDTLVLIKNFIQSLLTKLAEVNKELKNKITLDDIQKVSKMVAPSTAMITGVKPSGPIGSGVIIKDINNKKYILTNAHVIDGIDQKQKRLNAGVYILHLYNGDDDTKPILALAALHTLRNGQITYSPPEEHDIALLEIVSNTRLPENLGVQIRDITQEPIAVGEPVIAIGSPFGAKDTITFGVVSHTHRQMPLNSNSYIQTDAAIAPGNSGGGLFDLKGRLIGINTWAIQNLGGSIRIDEIKEVLDSWDIFTTSKSESKKMFASALV